MSEWQPIETAPKDGTVLLLYRYTPGSLSWVIGYAEKDAGKIVWIDYSQPYKRVNATHWMPLPEAPTA